jgi:uncharacterized protein YcbX
VPTVSSLFVYPLKSARGISLLELAFDSRGPVPDRRWMLVDDRGAFLTQRENPRLALLSPEFDGDGLVVSAPDTNPIRLPRRGKARTKVNVWRHETLAEDLGDECARWFTDVLEQSCRVVSFPDDQHRPVSRSHTDLSAEVCFSDGYPLLLLSLESLAELNRRLHEPLPMSRFRPNVVVRDCQPFEEDEWKTLAAPGLRFDLVKPCVRCKITTLNANTLEYGKEPLRTLAKFRRNEDGVIFGQNGVHHGPGKLAVGDLIQVESLHPSLSNPPRRT